MTTIHLVETFVRRISSFTYLNVTQFLGALNDNIYKLLIVYFFISLDGMENSHFILASTGATFVLPFLFFSASSGILADRFSKRNIIVLTKILELVTMALGVLFFHFESKLGSYLVLFLLATQSAIFGPSKYGIVPELVASDKISKANGMMTSFTFLAIIFGTFLSSFILDVTGRNFIFAALLCTALAIIGLATSFCIEYTPPSGSSKRFNILFIREIMETIRFASKTPSLLACVFGSSFFLFLGAFIQLNMIPYAVHSLHLTDVQGGYLFLLTAMGIGTGSVVAGKVSGKYVELGMVPVAGAGVAVCCYLMDLCSHSLIPILPLVALLGLFGGMYEIPLDSYIQVATPRKHRGQVVATANFFSFFGVLCASALLYLIDVLGISSDKSFTIVGSITLMVTILVGFKFFDYTTRFSGMVLSRIHFQTTYTGVSNIPSGPAVYVCYHTAWNDTLLMLGAQRRRMRFFIEQEQDHSKWMKKLYRLLKVYLLPGIEPLENNPACAAAIRAALDKGISVCIFVSNEDICGELERLKNSYSFRILLEQTHYPMIPVAIEKGEKNSRSQFLMRMLKKVHVPAAISFGSPIKGAACEPALLDEEAPYVSYEEDGEPELCIT